MLWLPHGLLDRRQCLLTVHDVASIVLVLVLSVAGQRGDHSPQLLCRHKKWGQLASLLAVPVAVVHWAALGVCFGLEPSEV